MDKATLLLAGSAVIGVGMAGRFLKFYAAYSREVLIRYGSSRSSTGSQAVKDPGT